MQPQESSVGPVIATIVILAVIVLGGLYFWSQRPSTTAPTTSTDSYGASSVATPASTSTPSYDTNSPMSGS
jgi:hypothetical protein